MKKICSLVLLLALALFAVGATASTSARLTTKMATRSGPSTKFTDLGTYFRRGTTVKAITKSYDSRNRVWWIQVDFTYRNAKRRAYTGRKRMTVSLGQLPEEKLICRVRVMEKTYAWYGPGENYEMHSTKTLRLGLEADVYNQEAGWFQLEYKGLDNKLRRVWVPESACEVLEASKTLEGD